MQQTIQDALRETEEDDSRPNNPKSKSKSKTEESKAKQAGSVRDVLAALNRGLASSDSDSDDAAPSKPPFSSKALSDYLKKNRDAITAAVEKERAKRVAATAGLKMRKPAVHSPRFQALTAMFGKRYEGEDAGENEEERGVRIKDEL